ncbi:MAG: AAA family ATPase [Fibrobacter sp.]|nr:AAA family ATPase [Fibrobacter sp.]
MANEKKSASKPGKNPWLELFEDLWKNKILVLAFVFCFAVLGAFVAQWSRPVYEANSLLQVKSKSSSLSAMLGDVGSLLGMAGGSSDTEIQLMQSRRVLDELIDSLGLQNEAMPVGVLDRLLHREGRVDIRYLKLPNFSVIAPERYKQPWSLVVDDSVSFSLYDDLGQKVLSCSPNELCSVPYMGDTTAIRVSLMNATPGQKFKVTQKVMIKAVNSLVKNLSISEVGKKTGILNIAYQSLYADKAVLVVDSLAAIYLRLNQEFGSSDMKSTLALLEAQLPVARRTLDSLMIGLNDYREKIGSADIAAETKITLESQVRLQQQIIQLEQMREEKARLFDSSHPQIVTMDKQIASLKRELARASTQTKKLPETQQKILTMTTEAQYAQTIYSDLLKRVEQLRLLVASSSESAQIIDSAIANPEPVKPKKKMILLVFVFAGFCASFGYISLRKKMKGVTDPFLVSKTTGVSVYSLIPKGESEAAAGLQTLQLSLELESFGKDRVLCVSGLLPGVGASFVSSRLAKAFAASGKKVLLIDADLQNGTLGSEFGISHSDGLVEALAEKTGIASAIHSVQIPNLDVLLSGSRLMSSEGVFGADKFTNFIKSVRDSYDMVILDTPALLIRRDASLISRVSDEVLLILEYGRHSLESIQEGIALLPKTPNPTKVIAFNKCTLLTEKKNV